MKQCLRILFCLAIILSLCSVNTLPIVRAAPAVQTATDATSAQIQERGSIIAGVKFDAPPFGSVDADGEVSGFEVDLLREFARRWLGDPDAVEFVQVTSGNRIDRLLNGDIDLIAATMTVTPERAEQIDFSRVYYLDGQNILVNSDRTPVAGDDAERIQMLDGSTIAAIQGSTSIDRIQQFAVEHSIVITVAEFEQYDQVVQPLLDGRVDALTTDHGILTGLAQAHAELAILLDENFSEEPYGLGVQPGDSAFVEQINQTLLDMKADGTYDAIYARWFPTQPPFDFGLPPAAAAPVTAANATVEPTATPTETPLPPPTTLPVTGSAQSAAGLLPVLGLLFALILLSTRKFSASIRPGK